MKLFSKCFLIILAVMFPITLLPHKAFATSAMPVELDKLFQKADLVGYVHILAGDAEHFDGPLYKAKVVTAFKGCVEGDVVYFGPLAEYGIGSEYLSFLQKTGTSVSQHRVPEKPPDSGELFESSASYHQIMYEGYAMMPSVRRIEIFNDEALKVAYEQILLPRELFCLKLTYDLSVSHQCLVPKKSVFEYLSALPKNGHAGAAPNKLLKRTTTAPPYRHR